MRPPSSKSGAMWWRTPSKERNWSWCFVWLVVWFAGITVTVCELDDAEVALLVSDCWPSIHCICVLNCCLCPLPRGLYVVVTEKYLQWPGIAAWFFASESYCQLSFQVQSSLSFLRDDELASVSLVEVCSPPDHALRLQSSSEFHQCPQT